MFATIKDKVILGLLLGYLVCFGLYKVKMMWIEADHVKELSAQHAAMTKRCSDEKAVTEGVDNALQDQLSSVRSQLAALKRMRKQASCVNITAQPTSSSNAGTSEGKLPGPNGKGLERDWLLDFAAEAETTRQQLIGCQSFINQTWKLKENSK